MTRWHRGEQAVAFLISRGRLDSFEASDPAALAETLAGRAARRLEATAKAALANGDADGAYAAACDAYRMAAEALLARPVRRRHPGIRQADLRTAAPHAAHRPVRSGRCCGPAR